MKSSEGYKRIEIRDFGYNYEKPDGNLLCKRCYDFIYSFECGIAKVQHNKKFNFIDLDGNLLFNNWFEEIYESIVAKVYMMNEGGNKWKIMNKNRKFISERYFYGISTLTENLFIVNDKRNLFNILHRNGNLCLKRWVNEIFHFDFYNNERTFCKIHSNSKGYNFVNIDGKLVSDIWFASAHGRYHDAFPVMLHDGRRFWLDFKGNLVYRISHPNF